MVYSGYWQLVLRRVCWWLAIRGFCACSSRFFLGGMGKRVVYVLETWKDALMFYRHNYHRLLLALLLCLPIHGLSFVTTYILAVNLGIVISFSDICMILALVWVITAIPITISGVGVRELSLIYFLSLYGVKAESATALSVYLYIVSVILGLIGLVFLFSADPRLYVRGE